MNTDSIRATIGEIRLDAFGLPFVVPASEADAANLVAFGKGADVQVTSNSHPPLRGKVGVSVFGVPYVSPVSKADENALAAYGKGATVVLHASGAA